MPKCLHKNVSFLGFNETIFKNKFLPLYNCKDCLSTISLSKNFITITPKNKKITLSKFKGDNHANRKSHKG